MATLRQRLRMQAPDGTYNTVHLETTADHVLMPDGTTLSTKLTELKSTIDSLSASHGLIHSIGDVFTWAGYTWRTVHITDDYEYAILNIGPEKVQFGFNNVYATSTLVSKCDEFLSTISSVDQELLADIKVNGVTSKVFVPSYEQVIGGFTWFGEKVNRAYTVFPDFTQTLECMSTAFWWTSSPSGDNVYYVRNDGSISSTTSTDANMRFRPCIAFVRQGEATIWRL